jgi:hypothetical protein
MAPPPYDRGTGGQLAVAFVPPDRSAALFLPRTALLALVRSFV